MTSPQPPIFTETSAYSLAFVTAVGITAHVAAKALLPKNARWQDRVTFVWLVRGIFSAMFSTMTYSCGRRSML